MTLTFDAEVIRVEPEHDEPLRISDNVVRTVEVVAVVVWIAGRCHDTFTCTERRTAAWCDQQKTGKKR